MTFLGEIDKARGWGDAQCEAQSVILAQPHSITEGPKRTSQGTITKNAHNRAKERSGK
jgi:hypothetical protein